MLFSTARRLLLTSAASASRNTTMPLPRPITSLASPSRGGPGSTRPPSAAAAAAATAPPSTRTGLPQRLADRSAKAAPPPPPSDTKKGGGKAKTKPKAKPATRDAPPKGTFTQLVVGGGGEDGAAGAAAAGAGGGGADFEALGLDGRVLSRLAEQGIHAPTPVQTAGIPAILSGRNVALHAPTGSGKTLAFLLPVLHGAIERAGAEAAAVAAVAEAAAAAGTKAPPPPPPSLQAIIVSPSRELAMQTTRVAHRLLPDAARGWVQQAIGGANPARQIEAIRRNRPLLVVGTPGRLAELSRSGALQTHGASVLVFDEADQLLAPQFREEVGRLADHTGKRAAGGRQTVLVSATLTPGVVARYARWCPDPAVVSTAPEVMQAGTSAEVDGAASTMSAAPSIDWGWGAPGAAGAHPYATLPTTSSAGGGTATADAPPALPPTLTHAWLPVRKVHRTDALRKALHALGSAKALIFMNFGSRLQDTAFKLAARGVPAAVLHGAMGKASRRSVMADFEAGRVRALVVSDVAARGLDFPGCDAVINLELPTDAAHYAHRAGRTGRAGRPGVVLTLAEEREGFVVERLGKRLGVAIPEAKLEGGRLEC